MCVCVCVCVGWLCVSIRHLFCGNCLLTALLRQSVCPLCRATAFVVQLQLLRTDATKDSQALWKAYSALKVRFPQSPHTHTPFYCTRMIVFDL